MRPGREANHCHHSFLFNEHRGSFLGKRGRGVKPTTATTAFYSMSTGGSFQGKHGRGVKLITATTASYSMSTGVLSRVNEAGA